MPGVLLRPGRRGIPPTRQQYAILRYWAAYTTDPARHYVATHGPAPRAIPRTLDILDARGWAAYVPGVPGALVIPDEGRRAAGLRPAWRDRACPVCQVQRWERCRVGGRYVDETHQERGDGGPRSRPEDVHEPITGLTGYDPHGPVGYVVAT